MAISGVANADVVTIARRDGLAFSQVAYDLNNFSYLPHTQVVTDTGSHTGSMALVGHTGQAIIDWGDGTVTSAPAATTPRTHVYAGAGTYTITITSYGYFKSQSKVIA